MLFWTSPTFVDISIFLIVYAISFFLIYISTFTNRPLYYPDIRIVLLFFLFGLIGKTFSRWGYASGLLGGLDIHSVRDLGLAGTGGWYSLLSVFFYPAAIFIFYCSNKYRFYFVIYLLIWVFLAFDILAAGMRATPIFVIIFWVIPYFAGKISFNKISMAILFFLLSIFIFEYTTRIKSKSDSDFILRNHLKYTISTQTLQIKPSILDANLNKYIYSYIFLSHYVAHSVAELSYYLTSDQLRESNLGLYRLKHQFCPIIDALSKEDCDFSQNIKDTDETSGTYKTFYFKILVDFGALFSLAIVFLLSLFYIYIFFARNYFSIANIVALVIVVLSPIENFILGGPGILAIIVIFLIAITSRLLRIF